MAYIGPEPNPGQNREVDDISSGFNGSEVNFTLQVNGQNVSPGSSNNIIVSLGGVVQNPGTDYTVAASTLTFTTAPANGLSFFGLVLGQQVDIQSVADGSIVNASVSGSAAIAGTKISPNFGSQNILTTGNSGVGTATPESKLAVKGSSGAADLFSISDVAVPTSGGEYGVAMIKTNSTEFALNITGYNTASKGLKIYNNGGSTARTSFQIAHAAGTKFIVDGTGNVGIGTDDPNGESINGSQNLVIMDTSSDGGMNIKTGTSGNAQIHFSDTSGNGQGRLVYAHADDSMKYFTGGTERMRNRAVTGGLMINDDGSNRIGEPMLHVHHGGSSKNVASFFYDTTDDRDVLLIRHNGASGSTSRGMINFLNSAGNGVGHIHGTGSGVTYNSVSDYRLKENVVAISDGITRLKTLKPSRFNFIADPGTTVDGFLAHEVTAVPEAVIGTKDETKNVLYRDGDEIPEGKNVGDIKETVPNYQEMDQSRLVPLLTAALQEAVAKIELLETKVAALEAA